MILSLILSFALAETPSELSRQGLRSEVLTSADDYLNARLSSEQFYELINKWNEAGWSLEEKSIILDTLQKSIDPSSKKQFWLCNLKPEDFCETKKYFSNIKWPEYLADYDTLIFAGQAYPKFQWNSLILNGKNHYVFVSKKFAAIEVYGEANELKMPAQPELISHKKESEEIPSFYQKHKKKIWWTVGGVLIATGLFSLAGKKLVITHMGF